MTILKRYAGEGILVFDGDEAGLKAAEKALVKLGMKKEMIYYDKFA